ncbi:MAG: alpha/beta fold hydrolase [Flammeovirgaceae bacterium]
MVILHGLFGSSDNWYSLSKLFAEKYEVYTVDQRNHGQSPHIDEVNYKILAADLEGFLQQQGLTDPVVIGHSMGGKTAMNLAIKNPAIISKLIVVDIAPRVYPIHHDHILDGLTAIPLESIQSRNEAEAILAEYVDEADVRQFLLKNLSRNSEGKFVWKINLRAIEKHIEEIGAGMQFDGVYTKPTLFIKGARSNYFKPGDDDSIRGYFPEAKIVTVNTGHWVQAEDPKAFMDAVNNFLN